MSTACRKFFKSLSMYSNVPILVYEPGANTMLRYKSGAYKTMPVPEVLERSLHEDETVIGFFSKGGSKTIVYFLRSVIDGVKCVCVVKDTWLGDGINDFFKAYFSYSAAAAERIEEFKEKDNLISNLYRFLFDADPIIGDDVSSVQAIRKEMEDKINELRNIVHEKDAVIWETNSKLERIASDFREANSQIRLLRTNYDSMRVLLDRAELPLYCISEDYIVLNANKSSAAFARINDPIELIGKKCYEVFLGAEEPCSWCKLKQVFTTGESYVYIGDIASKRYDISFFPIADQTGKITSCGCMITDNSGTHEMEISMNRVKEQLKNLKKSKIADINEIQELKKLYDDLSRDHALLLKQCGEMSGTIEKLKATKSDNTLSSEAAVKYKNELAHLNEELLTYKRNLKNLQLQYSDLRKRSFFQIERLIKIMDSPKYYVSNSELREALRVLKSSVNELKRVEALNENKY